VEKAVQEFKDELKAKNIEIQDLQKQLGKSTMEKEWLAKKLESSVSFNKRKHLWRAGSILLQRSHDFRQVD